MDAVDPTVGTTYAETEQDAAPAPTPPGGPGFLASKFNLRMIAGVAAAHFVNDFYASFLAPLLPLVVGKFHISFMLAGLLATIFTTSSALSQPLFALLSDRMRTRILVALGPTLTVLGMGLLGLAPSYGALIGVLLIAGVGTAAFHPQGASTAGHASGTRKGMGVSLFVTGGELGFSLGPILIALLVTTVGLRGTAMAAVPGLAACLVLWWTVARGVMIHAHRAEGLRADLQGAWRPLGLLYLSVLCRSIIIQSYVTFLPLLLRARGGSLIAGGAAVFLFGGIGAIGGLVGGTLSDRVGRRAVLVVSFLLGIPLLLIFIRSQGTWAYPFLALSGLTLYLTAAVTIVMGQELLPRQASVASSIVMGLAWGMAGLSLTAVGALADAIGLASALTAILALGLVALIAVLMMPKASAHAR